MFDLTKKNLLTNQIMEATYAQLIHCFQTVTRHFYAGETICRFGENHQSVGIIVSGSASIIRNETNGNRTILESLNANEIFGEILSFPTAEYESIYIVCQKDCEIIFFDYLQIMYPCPKICQNHCQLIQNLLIITSNRISHLNHRIELLTKRSIREKLICYFYQITADSAAHQASIPFTMSDLADYLCVDRSAMTRELKKLKNEDWIHIDKYTVTIKKSQPA